jgi:NitT/TauT family transport system substrate-binding protein
LLQRCRQQGVCSSVSNGHEARVAGDCEGDELLCAEPEQAARLVAARGYPYDYALQTMKEIRYARWKEYDPEDTVRFYSLRLREAGMIKSIPSKIIAQGTDWRFFNELKQELKS